MSIWVSVAILSMIFFSFSNVLSKYFSLKFSIEKSLFYQYLTVSIYWFFLVFLFDSFAISNSAFIYLLFLWIIWYIGIWSFIKAFSNVNTWIVLLIANVYVFVSYFINNYILWLSDFFSVNKSILWLLFFLLIWFFLFERNINWKVSINKFIILPIITAFCWGIYWSLNAFLIKEHIFTPFQLTFYWEFSIFLLSIVIYLLKILFQKSNELFFSSLSLKVYLTYFCWGFFTFFGGVLLNVAYKLTSANVVNFINLFWIVLATILSYFLFNDKITFKQFILMLSSFVLLILFVFIN